jgi:hypothetical protein
MMDKPYAIMLLVFVITSLALVVVFLWQLFSGKLRPHGTFGRGFEPIFPLDRTDHVQDQGDAARAGDDETGRV